VNPLLQGNASLLLWLILGYLLITAVLVVTFGRLGDMYGRVRIYNLGFAVCWPGSPTASSPMAGTPRAGPIPG
jgi:MFS family permease